MMSIPSRLLRPPSSSPLCSLAIFVSNFSTSQSHASLHQFPSRRHEEASRAVKVLVWWDFENCAVPVGVNVGKVANMISAAVRTNGIRGPLKIMAFGDVCRLSKTTLEEFSHTGIDLSHVPQGGKNSADTSIIINIMYWASQNPPPAHLFLISGDNDFAGVLHRLRMNNYNVLLASPRSGPTALCSAASIMWEWRSLINGDDLKGKHFNQPPDGPYGSWYGHDRAALEDPFSIEQLTCVQADESSKVCSNSNFRPIPKAITKNIMTILSAYPKGLPITVLRSELSKRNVSMDKDFYGQKKFSSFLASMHQSLRLRNEGGGQLYVRRVIRRASELSKCTDIVSEYDNVTGDEEIDGYSAFGGDDMSILDATAGKPTCLPSCEVSEGATQPELRLTPCSPHGVVNSVEFATENSQTPSPDLMKDVESASEKLCEIRQHSRLGSVSVRETSFPRRLLQLLYGYSVGSVNKLTHNLGLFEHVDKVPESFASDSSTMKNEKSATVRISKTASRQGGFLSWMLNCFWFRSSDRDNVAGGDIPSQRPNTKKYSPKKNEPFTEDSFWDEVKTFINSTRGSVLISRSKTRDEMAENLMKEGPPVVKSLSKTDVMHLMELLISGKRVEECLFTTPHLRLVRVGEKSCNTGSSSKANTLTSIFPKSGSKDNSQNEHLEEGRLQATPDSGLTAEVSNDESSVQSRRVIFSDCRKLVKHVTEQHPEGYNIGAFRNLFLDNYGYTLDYKKLGYQKLVSLLEVLPSVKVQGNNIFSASMRRGCSLQNRKGCSLQNRKGCSLQNRKLLKQ